MVTLLVNWIAEVLGEQAAGGRLPGWAYIQDALAATWPMVSASLAPLLTLVLARLAGATALEAANAGLAVAFVLLAFHGDQPRAPHSDRHRRRRQPGRRTRGKSMIPIALRMAQAVDGVVDVTGQLRFAVDDTHPVYIDTSKY